MSEDSVYSVKPIEEEVKNVEIAYYRPKFWKRVFCILFDAFICFLFCLAGFIGTRAIITECTPMKEKNETLNSLKLDSGLFLYNQNNHRIMDVVSFYNGMKDVSMSGIELNLKKSVDKFLTFIDKHVDEEESTRIRNEYYTFLLNPDIKFEGKPLFIEGTDGKPVKNLDAKIKSKEYVQQVYIPYIDKYGQGYFITKVPGVYDIQQENALLLGLVEVPVALLIGFTIVYYIVPLIFSRGRLTFGRMIYHIGLVDKNVLNVSPGKFTLRYLIFFFGEVLLSIATAGIPLFVSFSMMAFSKKKQTFHDYMLGIEEVDTENSKIYKSMEEINLPDPKHSRYKDFNLK